MFGCRSSSGKNLSRMPLLHPAAKLGFVLSCWGASEAKDFRGIKKKLSANTQSAAVSFNRCLHVYIYIHMYLHVYISKSHQVKTQHSLWRWNISMHAHSTNCAGSSRQCRHVHQNLWTTTTKYSQNLSFPHLSNCKLRGEKGWPRGTTLQQLINKVVR